MTAYRAYDPDEGHWAVWCDNEGCKVHGEDRFITSGYARRDDAMRDAYDHDEYDQNGQCPACGDTGELAHCGGGCDHCDSGSMACPICGVLVLVATPQGIRLQEARP